MAKNDKKPLIRFKGFTDAWEQRKLNEMVDYISSNLTASDASKDGNYELYDANNIIGRTNHEPIKTGYLTIIKDGAVGRIRKMPKNTMFIGTMGALKPINNSLDFVFSLLTRFSLSNEFSGSTVPHIYFKDYGNNIYSVPKLKEQNKIGDLYCKLDNLITLHQRKYDKLVNVKKALLDKIFPKNGSKLPEIRFKGFFDAWEQRKLFDIANYRNGKAHENDIDENGNYIVVNSKFVSTNAEVKKFSIRQNEPLLKDEIAFVLSDVPNGRALARTFLVPKTGIYTLNQRIAGITPLKGTNPYYLYTILNRNKYFLSFDDGAKQTNLSIVDMQKFEDFYPKENEQNKIGTMLNNFDNLITLHQRECDKLKNIKKSLLERMFV